MRCASAERTTRETAVTVTVDLDASGPASVSTGSPMLDHLLKAFALHAGMALTVQADSKDAIAHHLVEDVAIVLGQALAQALGERTCVSRYGDALVAMDDALVRCALDIGGRSYARTVLNLRRERIEDLASDMIPHFFGSLAANAGFTLHLDAIAGDDDHHIAEAAFKAFARASRAAWSRASGLLPVLSTKGIL
jgi:imidazoleglycerol phosphate dehydratase HisB